MSSANFGSVLKTSAPGPTPSKIPFEEKEKRCINSEDGDDLLILEKPTLMSAPRKPHEEVVHHILQYLKSTLGSWIIMSHIVI